ncbi:uncharacterized protein LOC108630689 isoform X2 [Ceratina calcarata]|uniref:Uncharacterized protein LOC108630689 isoform X2 n=1 Tax=Ceratina calcarata TaxID=156304 RepID=A0AAJ7JCQ9_9HYME|nr:uncharacterized protein LOC108630689 isoform X2 [Ceratina calcarata]
MAYKPNPTTNEEFTLYVTDIPFELNEDGLLEIFDHYGIVKGHFFRPRWAYVTYGSYVEAESAIRDLNNKVPLRLKVSFEKRTNGELGYNETSTPVSKREEHETSNRKNVVTPNKSMTPTMERTKPVDVRPHPGVLKQVAENGPGLLNGICSNADPYESTNALWTRGQLTVTPDGKRHVSLGRGYMLYEIPDSNPEIDHHINRVYEKRVFGLYEYGRDEMQGRVGNCKVCAKLTKFFCERCHTFYCSKICQQTDWPEHKDNCLQLPKISDSHAPLRQPKKLIDALKRSNGCSGESGSKDPEGKSDIAAVGNNLRAKLAREQSMRIKNEIENTTIPEQTPSAKQPFDEGKDAAKDDGPKQSSRCEKKWEKMEEDISFARGPFLPNAKSETPTSIVGGGGESVNKLKSVVNTVAVGEIGVLEIHSKINNGTYGITFLPNNAIGDYARLLDDLPRKCAEAAQNSRNHKPTVGDLMCGLRSGTENDWLRGYALSSSEMAVLEEATVVSVDKTVACPSEYSDIRVFGASCEVITDAKHEFKENNQIEFKVTARTGEEEQGAVEIELCYEQQNTIKATVKPWIAPTASSSQPPPPPPPPSSSSSSSSPPSTDRNAVKKDLQKNTLEFAKLKSGDEVVISTYRSPVHYFVRSLDSEEIEYFHHVMRNVGICAQKSSSLTELPTIGQMVLARFIDDNFYRAIVTKIEEDKKITISYIDFGNSEVTDIKRLKTISDDLKLLRSCSSKIILKDVPTDVPLTKEADEYLNILATTDVRLVCKFDGVPSKDGVYLIQSNGETVNKRMIELLTPASKKVEDEKICYMSNELSAVPLGNVGDTVQVLTLYTINECYQYAMCPFDRDLMVHVYDVMPKMMAEYCEAKESYIPRDKELCLAAYLNGWYRAVCTVRNYTATSSSVFFIDFGNTEVVSHENIRLMPKDFIAPNAMANICNIVNVAPTVRGRYPREIEEKIGKLIVPDSTVRIKIVRFDSESGQFDVELPSV